MHLRQTFFLWQTFFFLLLPCLGTACVLLRQEEGKRSLSGVLEHGLIRWRGERVKRRESIGGVETVIISAPQIKNDTHKQSRRCSQTQTAHFLQAQTPVRRSHSSSSKSDNRKPRKHGRHPWLRSSTRDRMLVVFYSVRKALFACEISWLM